jgi:plasmid stabilization system protein ParE
LKVTYTEEAVADIVQAITYLNERHPTAAAKLDADIAGCIERLSDREFDGPVSRLRSGAHPLNARAACSGRETSGRDESLPVAIGVANLRSTEGLEEVRALLAVDDARLPASCCPGKCGLRAVPSLSICGRHKVIKVWRHVNAVGHHDDNTASVPGTVQGTALRFAPPARTRMASGPDGAACERPHAGRGVTR